MTESYEKFILGLNEITSFDSKLDSAAKKSNLRKESALILIMIFEKFAYRNIFSSDFINELLNKNLIATKNSEISLTSKGEILAKSFINTINRWKIYLFLTKFEYCFKF